MPCPGIPKNGEANEASPAQPSPEQTLLHDGTMVPDFTLHFLLTIAIDIEHAECLLEISNLLLAKISAGHDEVTGLFAWSFALKYPPRYGIESIWADFAIALCRVWAVTMRSDR